MSTFLGAPYPITKHPRGLLYTAKGANVLKADLLSLLLTNPGERVMLPTFGTPLNKLVFEPNDQEIINQAEEMILNAIKLWEPRVVIQNIILEITNDPNSMESSLHVEDSKDDLPHMLMIRLEFSDFDDIPQINELVLQVPLGGS
jgi:hypothetical protein